MKKNQNPKEYCSDECLDFYPNADEKLLCGIGFGVVVNPYICSGC